MNYKSIYWSIIINRLDNPYIGYTEKHHILPISIGGDNSKENLVNLSAKEHYICHHLLTKMYAIGSIEHGKMLSAFVLMLSTRTNKKITAAGFSKLREEFSKMRSIAQTGELNSQFGSRWICNRTTLQETRLQKGNSLPNGWELGKLCLPTEKQIARVKRVSDNKSNLREANISKYTPWYVIYKEHGFEKFKEITGYNKSKPNLVQQFAKYVKEFVPQNGKQRG